MHWWKTSPKRSEFKKKNNTTGWQIRLKKGQIDEKVRKVKWTEIERLLKQWKKNWILIFNEEKKCPLSEIELMKMIH